jgi:hypothetical protein
MKRTLLAALCLVLLPAGVALAAGPAGCTNQAAMSQLHLDASLPAAAPLAGAGDAETADLAALLLDQGVIQSTEIQVSDFDFEICRWWNCILTPTGCGCSGFYCNGHFICGYRIK